MTTRRRVQPRVTLVLDADGLSKLARRDRLARQMVRSELEHGDARVTVPAVAAVQALVDGVARGAVDAVLAATSEAPLDRSCVDLAATLLRRTRTRDVPDGIVAAVALLELPSIIITSDPEDLRILIEDDPRSSQVAIWRI